MYLQAKHQCKYNKNTLSYRCTCRHNTNEYKMKHTHTQTYLQAQHQCIYNKSKSKKELLQHDLNPLLSTWKTRHFSQHWGPRGTILQNRSVFQTFNLGRKAQMTLLIAKSHENPLSIIMMSKNLETVGSCCLGSFN